MRQTFDSQDVVPFRHRGQHQARAYRPTVDQDRASAAHPDSTSLPYAAQLQLVAQNLEQGVMAWK
jgi:hypothetical protein